MIHKLGGSHRSLLRLFGWVFPEPDVMHVVMEKAERGLLAALQAGLPPFIRMNIAVDVAEGLKAIHEIKYTYEDLKPGNVLVRIEGERACVGGNRLIISVFGFRNSVTTLMLTSSYRVSFVRQENLLHVGLSPFKCTNGI